MVSHGHVTVARNTHGNDSGQLFTAYEMKLASSGATVGLQQGSTCRSCFWLLAGAGLMVLPLVMVTALSLLDWEGGHHRQVLGERRFPEPAPKLITLSKPAS